MHNTFDTTKMILFRILFIGASLALGGELKAPQDTRSTKQKMKELYDRIQPMTLYGKVVDMEGLAVSGAEVCIRWENADIFIGKRDMNGHRNWVKTDADGLWQCSIGKAFRAFASATKEGYESRRGGGTGDLVENKTSETAPAIIRLRKLGETTFLIVHPSGNISNADLLWTISNRSARVSLDLLAKVGETRTPPSQRYGDLLAEVTFNPTGRTWTVIYRATNGTDGIVSSDKLLYAAPEAGYQKEVVIQNPSPDPMYLYVRSRSPAIYSRLYLEHKGWQEPAKGECFRILYKAWINPYGERNLEYDTSIDSHWYVEKDLRDEAKAAIQAKRLPAKPDIPKRIKESNEKVAREKAAQARDE